MTYDKPDLRFKSKMQNYMTAHELYPDVNINNSRFANNLNLSPQIIALMKDDSDLFDRIRSDLKEYGEDHWLELSLKGERTLYITLESINANDISDLSLKESREIAKILLDFDEFCRRIRDLIMYRIKLNENV